jgi:hypothetical protein
MARNPQQPTMIFQDAFPLAFLKALFDLLKREYPKAWQACAHLPDAQARYLYPHARRASIEATVLDIAARFPEISVEAVPNASGDCHVEIRCGNVVLTISHADHPSRLVDDARFRLSLAEDNDPVLFDCGNRLPPGEWLYGILLHGSTEDHRYLGFADIVFPVPSKQDEAEFHYHADRLRLVSLFAERKDGGAKPEARGEPEIG